MAPDHDALPRRCGAAGCRSAGRRNGLAVRFSQSACPNENVARATVYYQFRSKTGLLEALCDDLAEAGQMRDLPGAFADPDPRTPVRRLIVVFAGFWAADRVVMRRLRAVTSATPCPW